MQADANAVINDLSIQIANLTKEKAISASIIAKQDERIKELENELKELKENTE